MNSDTKLTFYIQPFQKPSELFVFTLEECIIYLQTLLVEVPVIFVSYKDNNNFDIHTALHDTFYHIKHVYLNHEHTIENLTNMCVIYKNKQE